MEEKSSEELGRRILIVEDDPRSSELLEALLRAAGHETRRAFDGDAALAMAESPDVDLVLLDLLLPGVSGLDVCRRIRAIRPTLPVVVITALTDRASRVAAKRAGADDFLTKPVDDVELMARVHNLLRVKAWYDLRERQREAAETALEEVREQLLRAERLATLGTLAAGVGHELKNMATVLQASYQFIRERALEGLPPEPEDLEQLAWALHHVTQHGRHLLALGRTRPEAEAADLCEVVRATLGLARLGGRLRGIETELSLPAEPLYVPIGRTRLEQVLLNLLLNAADAVQSVNDRARRLGCRVQRDRAGDRVQCFVEDNGTGIPADVLPHIFEPYYTTKPPGHGTGLGMSVVKQIVEGDGGRIHVRSEPGAGTTVEFDLPPVAGAMPEAQRCAAR